MDLQVGEILTGKVTGITKFGAFVSVAPGKSGLVHISEISHSYVNEVRDHLSEGQEVSVKVIGLDGGKINLSIKAATAPPVPVQARGGGRPQTRDFVPRRPQGDSASQQRTEPSFEDRLKRFMQDSDNKISGLRQYSDRKGARRRGGK
jgi:S1 RNA binding domain protein